jgi:hypothetical protein
MPARFAAVGLLALALLAGCNRSETSAVDADAEEAAGDEALPAADDGKDDGTARDAGPSPETHEGRLEAGDPTLRSGEFVDEYKVQVSAGQWLDARMTSTELDPYLIVVAPSGAQEDNDDEDRAQGTAARVRLQATESGLYSVRATSFAPGETGAYTVTTMVGAGGDEGGADPFAKPERASIQGQGGLPGPTLPAPADGARADRGTLGPGDQTLRSGEYVDTYTFEGRQGERVTVDMTSAEFDPYLILWKPDGSQEDNDDYNGSTAHSQISTVLPAAGTYRVGATTYAPGMSGAYELTIQQGGAPAPTLPGK